MSMDSTTPDADGGGSGAVDAARRGIRLQAANARGNAAAHRRLIAAHATGGPGLPAERNARAAWPRPHYVSPQSAQGLAQAGDETR